MKSNKNNLINIENINDTESKLKNKLNYNKNIIITTIYKNIEYLENKNNILYTILNNKIYLDNLDNHLINYLIDLLIKYKKIEIIFNNLDFNNILYNILNNKKYYKKLKKYYKKKYINLKNFKSTNLLAILIFDDLNNPIILNYIYNNKLNNIIFYNYLLFIFNNKINLNKKLYLKKYIKTRKLIIKDIIYSNNLINLFIKILDNIINNKLSINYLDRLLYKILKIYNANLLNLNNRINFNSILDFIDELYNIITKFNNNKFNDIKLNYVSYHKILIKSNMINLLYKIYNNFNCSTKYKIISILKNIYRSLIIELNLNNKLSGNANIIDLVRSDFIDILKKYKLYDLIIYDFKNILDICKFTNFSNFNGLTKIQKINVIRNNYKIDKNNLRELENGDNHNKNFLDGFGCLLLHFYVGCFLK